MDGPEANSVHAAIAEDVLSRPGHVLLCRVMVDNAALLHDLQNREIMSLVEDGGGLRGSRRSGEQERTHSESLGDEHGCQMWREAYDPRYGQGQNCTPVLYHLFQARAHAPRAAAKKFLQLTMVYPYSNGENVV